jgi:SAM-dependent methyltransferase
MHRRLVTTAGDYWVCSITGQLERVDRETAKTGIYDEHWKNLVEQGRPTPHELQDGLKLIKRFEKLKKTGRMFEVASGLGTVLRAAQESGWQAEGVEFSAFAADHVQQVCGAHVHAGAVEDIDLEPGAYDLVIMDNIFEHLFEPRKVLEKMSRALRPGGAIFFQTLNAQCYSLHNRPTDWHYFGPGHLVVPTLVSLKQYLRHAGLRSESLKTLGFHISSHRSKHELNKPTRSIEKTIANVARHTRRGHRLQAVLRKPD